MPVALVGLAIASAGLHVAWNAAARAQGGRLRYMWLIMLGGGSLGLLIGWPWFGALDLEHLWPWLFATWVIHALYFTSLAQAYRRAELAWAYTLSRSLGVLSTALVASLSFGEHLSLLAWCGIALVILGSLLASGGAGRPQALWRVALIGLLIAAYSVVDSHAVRIAPPVAYIALLYLGSGVLVAPFALRESAAPGDARALLFGGLSLASYLLMLFAYRSGPVAPLLAVRQAAPLLAALGGYLFLREMPSRVLIAGTLLIVLGAALFTLAPA
ncbi:MAG: DMT family transporter [Thermaerobacter sp.]|nr:DMT family transporter [Thermaerobacter sp.]